MGQLRSCPGESFFNLDSECDVPCEPCPYSKNPCLSDQEGVFENREDKTCKSYISCSHGAPFTLSCPNDAMIRYLILKKNIVFGIINMNVLPYYIRIN